MVFFFSFLFLGVIFKQTKRKLSIQLYQKQFIFIGKIVLRDYKYLKTYIGATKIDRVSDVVLLINWEFVLHMLSITWICENSSMLYAIRFGLVV